MSRKDTNKLSFITGVVGALALLAIYFIIVTLAQSFAHAVNTFIDLWYWITALIIGFGAQVGLYHHIRTSLTLKQANATASVAATSGVSTVSMIACCAHHLSDVLPLLGLSAAALFLVKYQMLFIILGILSNAVGTVFMLRIMQQHSLFNEKGRLGFLFKYDLNSAFRATVVLSIIIFGVLTLIRF